MTTNQNDMTGIQLMDLTEAALRVTGTPAFASADYEGEIDSLQFVDADDPQESTWAFVPFPLDEEGNPQMGCNCCDHDVHGAASSEPSSHLSHHPAGRIGPIPFSTDPDGGEEMDDADLVDDSMLPVHPALAAELIKAHLREWLAERGWQVQLEMFKKGQRWRLADCLSFTDGGGDRLDTEYPAGEDELTVLCESVLAVNATGK